MISACNIRLSEIPAEEMVLYEHVTHACLQVFYRQILRVKRTDKGTNKSVLKELKTERTLLNLINARKLKYVGHALRNHRTSLMKTVYEGRLDGRRRKGRPPISLVTNLITACGLSLHQIVQKSQDRAGWQQKVRSSIATANTASGDADR
ncbi:endonuclease-reverse transcriptase [Elysia marginata]|uniref:Endonuclease-reverse transcriptase n=1 Tax=Elysia marginata TaxID=1093978 RepID=A0AAV4F7E7_9GAST|nr:endonuclease-reverse transcriptase [Elysia marginata]